MKGYHWHQLISCRRGWIIPTGLAISLLFSTCSQTESKKDGKSFEAGQMPMIYQIQNDSIVIGWDAGKEASGTIVEYEMYYNTQKDTLWKLIGKKNAANSNLGFTIQRSKLPDKDSMFYFGIKAVNSEGKKSSVHPSFDPSADPGNWMVCWPK